MKSLEEEKDSLAEESLSKSRQEEEIDLLVIQFERLQKVLPEILKKEQTKADFHYLPKKLILALVSSSHTQI